ncbi:MAG: hypothetical protein EOP14_06350 [Pseudomonas sp.]|nr:MAG: hypothetical protein EOP14_06350 [Pseudomonas sp.]
MNIRQSNRVNQSAPVGPKSATSSAARGYEVTSLIKISPARQNPIRPIPNTLELNKFFTVLSLPLSAAIERFPAKLLSE